MHYNLHNHQVFDEYSITDVGESLCQANNMTQNRPIFDDINTLTDFDFATQGTSTISIQHILPESDGHEVIGLAKQIPSLPSRLRYGDINIDGYPDLYLTLQIKDKKKNTISNWSLVMINSDGYQIEVDSELPQAHS